MHALPGPIPPHTAVGLTIQGHVWGQPEEAPHPPFQQPRPFRIGGCRRSAVASAVAALVGIAGAEEGEEGPPPPPTARWFRAGGGGLCRLGCRVAKVALYPGSGVVLSAGEVPPVAVGGACEGARIRPLIVNLDSKPWSSLPARCCPQAQANFIKY